MNTSPKHTLSPRVTVETQLDDLVKKSKVFTLAEAIDAIRECSPGDSVEVMEKDIRVVLEEDCSVFVDQADDALFHTRHAFFQDKTFRITRFETEKKEKVIIPGGRMTAFCHAALLPSEVKLILPNGKSLPTKDIRISIEEAAAYYNLLGAEEMFHTFEAESPANTPVLMSGDPSGFLTLTVFSTLPLGDPEALLFKVVNWTEGIFEVTAVSGGDFACVPEWLGKMEKSLCTVFEEYGFFPEIPEQIALAIWKDPTILSCEVPFESDRLLASSDLIEIILSGSRTHLWRNDEERPIETTQAELPEGVLVSSGATDSPEAILDELKCPITLTEILAVMRDVRFRGGDQFEEAYNRLFAPWHLEFTDDAQEAIFMNYLEAAWEDVTDDYNRANDQETGRVRHFALGINNERLRWLAHLAQSDVEPCEHQLEILEEIGGLSAMILKLLGNLNEHVVMRSETEADQLIEALTRVADQMDALKQQFEAHHGHDHA